MRQCNAILCLRRCAASGRSSDLPPMRCAAVLGRWSVACARADDDWELLSGFVMTGRGRPHAVDCLSRGRRTGIFYILYLRKDRPGHPRTPIREGPPGPLRHGRAYPPLRRLQRSAPVNPVDRPITATVKAWPTARRAYPPSGEEWLPRLEIAQNAPEALFRPHIAYRQPGGKKRPHRPPFHSLSAQQQHSRSL
jgi:hypothetical protein